MTETTTAGLARMPPMALLIAISAIGPIALNIFMPSMPGMQAAFGVDYNVVQLTLTVYLVAMAASQIIFGPLSDRFGRRPTLIAGLVLFVVGSALATAATNITFLILARVIQGIGGASGHVIVRAIIRDCASREKSASTIGYVTMGMVVGPMLAPLAGGLLDEVFGWRAGFAALVLVGLLALPITIAALKETHTVRESSGLTRLFGGARILIAEPAFWGYTVTLSFGSAAFFAFLAATPLIAIDVMGLPPSAYGQYFLLGALGYLMGNFFAGRFSERLGPDRMILIGCIIGIAATFGLLATTLAGPMHPLALFGPSAVVAFSNGLVLPNATASIVSIRPDIAGAAAGLSGALQLCVGALATVVVSAFLTDNAMPMALAMAAAIWISFVGSWVGRIAMRRLAATE